MGTLAPTAVERLKGVGAWINRNSESIYGTEASPCSKVDWGYITMKKEGNTTILYLHVFDWKADSELLVPIINKAQKAYLLTNNKKTFKTKTGIEGLSLKLTGAAPDAINSVVVLELAEAPDAIQPKPFGQSKDGVVAFITESAEFENLQGFGIKYNSSKDCIGNWTNEQERVYWTFVVEKPGVFHATAQVASQAKSEFTVELAGQTRKVNIPASGSNEKFDTIEIGSFNIEKPGEYKIVFRPVEGSWNPVNLRGVQLKLKK